LTTTRSPTRSARRVPQPGQRTGRGSGSVTAPAPAPGRSADYGLLFPSSLGTPVQEYIVRKVFARICAVADVPVMRVHDLRHTAATLMLLAGVNVKVVSERLGHSSIAITLQTYAHVLPSMGQDAANVLEAMLRPSSAAAT
jgi:integrase